MYHNVALFYIELNEEFGKPLFNAQKFENEKKKKIN